jgi:hypothetical protein
MEVAVIAVEKHLRQTRARIDELRAPAAPGVYACFLLDGSSLKPFAAGSDGLVYVGVTADLAEREFEQHFNSNRTGFSTLRRSLGAIVKERLNLTAVPRSPGASESNMRCYRFTEQGEQRLTEWMRRTIEVGVCGIGLAPDLEKMLIARMRPLLNLKGWPNPDRKEIKRLRKFCADEARSKR